MNTRATEPVLLQRINDADLPSEVNGWKRHERNDNSIVEYWRKGSNHVLGAYEQLQLLISRSSRSRSNTHKDIRLHMNTYNQFNLPVSTRTVSTYSQKSIEYALEEMERIMNRHQGIGVFTEPPTFPKVINGWKCDDYSEHTSVEKFCVWKHSSESTAKFIVNQSYSSSGDPTCTLKYSESKTGELTVICDVPRTYALEIATHSLRNLPVPIKDMKDKLKNLKSVKGIGPKKSKKLLLLGIEDTEELASYCNTTASNSINSYHQDRIDKILTDNIKKELATPSKT